MDAPKDAAPEGSLTRLCARCAKPATMMCSRCLSVAFCDVGCQRGAWRDHKPLCMPAATALTAMVTVGRLAPDKDAVVSAGASPALPVASQGLARVVALMLAHPEDARVADKGALCLFE